MYLLGEKSRIIIFSCSAYKNRIKELIKMSNKHIFYNASRYKTRGKGEHEHNVSA